MQTRAETAHDTFIELLNAVRLEMSRWITMPGHVTDPETYLAVSCEYRELQKRRVQVLPNGERQLAGAGHATMLGGFCIERNRVTVNLGRPSGCVAIDDIPRTQPVPRHALQG